MATLRRWRTSLIARTLLCFMAASLAWLQVGPAYGLNISACRMVAQREVWRLAHLPHVALPPGLTQTPDAALQKKIEAKQAASAKPTADVRLLSAQEMGRALGRGPFRNPYFAGAPMPWHRSLRDVNLCTGNLFKSFTDVQVAPARGAGLVLQRTYNSDDARVGPFGIGWTHAYDIRIQEAAAVSNEDANTSIDTKMDDVPRTDFFGHKHSYHRDADGLYSPPPYLYDEMNSEYGKELVSGPPQVMDDTEKGMDGTVKHYVNVVMKSDGSSGNERACDYIQDRYGNKTTLTYGLSYVQADNSTRKLLTQVADPTGRTLTFQWTNFGTTASPAYRITEVDAPTDLTTGVRAYRVTYAYYGASDPSAGGASYQLKSVTLDPDGLNRTTTYTYVSCAGTSHDTSGNPQSATEFGLLASVSDPLGNTVSYTYGTSFTDSAGDTLPTLFGTLWVLSITEPGSGGNHVWSATYSGYGQFDNNISQDAYGVCYGSNGLLNVSVAFDSQLRVLRTMNNDDPNYFGGFHTDYDVANNATVKTANSDVPSSDLGNIEETYSVTEGYATRQYATYGPHGNILTTSTEGYPGETTTTAYYNASQYFQKQSDTDANGHSMTCRIGSSSAGLPNDVDSNPGDRGNILGVQDAGYGDSASPNYQKQYIYTYNQYGQKTSETNLNGIRTQYCYGGDGSGFAQADTDADDIGDLIAVIQDPGAGHLNRTTTMHYDIMGRVLNSTDPSGLTSTFSYNSLGQPMTVATPARGTTSAETLTYVYDGNGRTHSVTDNRGTTVMAYENGSDRVSSVTDPMTGTVGYTYMLSGERKTMSLPGGGTWTYLYRQPDNTRLFFQGSYVDPQQTRLGDYHRYGYVLPKDDPNSIQLMLARIIDDQGRVVDSNLETSGSIHELVNNETFDRSGSLASYSYTHYLLDGSQSTAPLADGHDGHLRLSRIRSLFYSTNASGQKTANLLGESDYTYDKIGQKLTNQVMVPNTSSNGGAQYTGGTPQYDSYGLATNQVITTRTEKYTYDDLNRLSTVDYGDGETQGYGFDPMGNRLTKSDIFTSGGITTTNTTASTFDAANRLLTVAQNGAAASAVTSDADGNTLTDTSGRTMTWDSQNRMASCTKGGVTSTYTYGADGLRRSSTVSGITTYYAYDGQTMIREMKRNINTGQLMNTATYFQGPRGTEYRRDDTQVELDSQGHQVSVCRWYVYDGLVSVVGEVDPAGNLTSSPKYDVYGVVRGNPGTASSRQGFVGGLGHVSDDTGLIYMRARYYDPQQGRFVSQDTKCIGNNWFIYCNNNPVNYTDADGKDPNMELIGYIGQFMLSALTSRTFQVSLATMFMSTLACILAPLAFVVGSAIPFGGLASGAAGAIMTVQAISAMISAIVASPGVGAAPMIPSAAGPIGAALEISNMIAGYGSGLYLIMAADDAYQELT